MAKIKKMCKADDEKFKKIKDDIFEEVREPKYVCKKCLRVAKSEDLICKPKKIK